MKRPDRRLGRVERVAPRRKRIMGLASEKNIKDGSDTASHGAVESRDPLPLVTLDFQSYAASIRLKAYRPAAVRRGRRAP